MFILLATPTFPYVPECRKTQSWNGHSTWLGDLSLYTWPAKNIHSTLLAVISLFNWPAQIIQSSAGGFPSNHIECLTSHHQLTKTCNQLCLANPTDKYACQWSSSPPARSFTGSHICQLDLLGIADYIVFVSEICNVCAILHGWKEIHLRKIELSVQVS